MLKKIVKKILKIKTKFASRYQMAILKILGATIGENVRIRGKLTVIGNPSRLSIGDGCSINEGVLINCRDTVVIGKRCHISANTQIHTGALILNELPRKHLQASVVIGDDVWIAAHCVINLGVVIADRCVVGGNSTVLKSLEIKEGFYAGSPARFIKSIAYTDYQEGL